MNEREIFTEALLRPDPAERATFLNGACGPDVASRRRIEALLALHERDRLLLDRGPLELIDELAEPIKRDDVPASSPEAPAALLAAFLSPSTRPGALGREQRAHDDARLAEVRPFALARLDPEKLDARCGPVIRRSRDALGRRRSAASVPLPSGAGRRSGRSSADFRRQDRGASDRP